MDTGKLLPIPDDMKYVFRDLLDDKDVSDSRLINAASIVDPPEYLECCKICHTPDKEHAVDCIFEIISILIEE